MSKIWIVNIGAALSIPIIWINNKIATLLYWTVYVLLWVPLLSRIYGFAIQSRLRNIYKTGTVNNQEALILLRYGFTVIAIEKIARLQGCNPVTVVLDHGCLTWDTVSQTSCFRGPGIDLVDQPPVFGDIDIIFPV